MKALSVDELMSKIELLAKNWQNLQFTEQSNALANIRAHLAIATSVGKKGSQFNYPEQPDVTETAVGCLDKMASHLTSALQVAGHLPNAGKGAVMHHNVFHTVQSTLALVEYARRQH